MSELITEGIDYSKFTEDELDNFIETGTVWQRMSAGLEKHIREVLRLEDKLWREQVRKLLDEPTIE